MGNESQQDAYDWRVRAYEVVPRHTSAPVIAEGILEDSDRPYLLFGKMSPKGECEVWAAVDVPDSPAVPVVGVNRTLPPRGQLLACCGHSAATTSTLLVFTSGDVHALRFTVPDSARDYFMEATYRESSNQFAVFIFGAGRPGLQESIQGVDIDGLPIYTFDMGY